jgi:uncharacterized protein (DUF362 family)
MFKVKKTHKITMAVLLFSSWLVWDFTQAANEPVVEYKSFKMAGEFPVNRYNPAQVAIVTSDDPALSSPIATGSDELSYTQIEAMVRRAVELAGGLKGIIKPGNMVLLKPNIVDPEPPGSGEVTDVRVVKAMIRIVNSLYPGQVELVIGEGAPRPMDYEMKFQQSYGTPQWKKLWDRAGYQELLTDPDLKGIRFRLSNLNGSPPEEPWRDLVEVAAPGGGEALPQGGKYFIHRDVLNADVYITIPVLKIHTPGMTAALKNQIGLAPSTKYGFNKVRGVSQDGFRHKLVHEAQAPYYWTDKEIVDLSQLAKIKFTVVDAIACLEIDKSARWSGKQVLNLVRLNTIVAGADPVAVDHVCARMMGLNPDDIEHITLAEKVGLGTNDPARIQIRGAGLEKFKRRFKKSPSWMAKFGQSNREWLVSGAFSTVNIKDPLGNVFIPGEAQLQPKPGDGAWSQTIYFTQDRIDLGDYLGKQNNIVGYAFTFFDAPRDQVAELWIGSDEALAVYINGELAYRFSGERDFGDRALFSERVMIRIKAGENRLLVKALQRSGYFHFSLNICEPETNPDFEGNRIWGLKFRTAVR